MAIRYREMLSTISYRRSFAVGDVQLWDILRWNSDDRCNRSFRPDGRTLRRNGDAYRPANQYRRSRSSEQIDQSRSAQSSWLPFPPHLLCHLGHLTNLGLFSKYEHQRVKRRRATCSENPKAKGKNNRDPSSAQQVQRSAVANSGAPASPEAISSISSGLSIVGKIVGHGTLQIFGHVEGELHASTVQISDGAQVEGNIVAEELTIGGRVQGHNPCQPSQAK